MAYFKVLLQHSPEELGKGMGDVSAKTANSPAASWHSQIKVRYAVVGTRI
jgi:hypothetical protein